jgi:photosystem II stability/assembly factor-like uncharacterized protein
MRVSLPVALLLALSLLLPSTLRAQVEPGHLAAVEARNIGPAGMSGRVAAVAVVPGRTDVIFVGSATGGVFRSTDGGIRWEPVFDEQEVLGIGAVAVSPANPDLIWVGTGEGNPRNSAGVGYGIYRSRDGGDTWEHLGLEDSERIHRVIPHPTDPRVAWVAAMGPTWREGGQRGVFRTTDGGETWERILGANETTGAADLVLDPENPDKLMAALWDHHRDPWFFRSGGPGSGLFLTHDGGDSWSRLEEDDGLPPGELGRIGLAFAPSDPSVAYALVEAERSELLRSEDGGTTWRTISDREGVAPRPFYYADLRVDPSNENRLYSLHGRIEVSEDQGRSFELVVPSRIIHGDVHELWIDPADPSHMIMGNDGGIGITWDRGESWRFVENLTLAQYYRISLDDETPFNVYGGLQDNGSWYGPSDVWESRGILNGHWRRVGGGDGFSTFSDPTDDRYGYSMSQQGNLYRFDKITGHRHTIQPVHPEGVPLRFHWNAGLTLDPHDPRALYLGSQYVHRTRDHGASWEILSPDLTTDDPEKQRQDVSGGLTLDATGAENHTTIVDIAVSPLEEGVIWVGTDDGNVQLTRDDGGSWTNVGANIEGIPAATWVADVEPSHHDPATAYVVLDDHRRGNWETYLFRTTDYGSSWERLTAPGQVFGFAHDVEEDPETPQLLVLGTEFGPYLSLDGGETWMLWTSGGLPPAPVRESRIHPRDADLALGTHGRGIWIVDDIRPLRALAADPDLRSAPVHAFPAAPATLHEIAEGIGYRSTGHAMWQGATRPYGALLSYWVAPGSEAPGATLTVRTPEGQAIRTLDGPAEPGVNRVVWNLRAGDEEGSPVPQGREVLPGRYEVEVEVGETTSSTSVEVRTDPRSDVPLEGRVAKQAALARASEMGETVRDARGRILGAQRAVARVLEMIDADDHGDLVQRGRALRDTLEAADERLFSGPDCQGICGGDPVASRVQAPIYRLAGSPGAPTPLEEIMLDQARTALEEIVAEVNRLLADEVRPFGEAVEAAEVGPFDELDPVGLPGGGG